MNLGLREDEGLQETVTVILTRRDVLLLNLCLQLVSRDYTRNGTLRFDIQRLRDKLSLEQQANGCSSTSKESRKQRQTKEKGG